MLAMGTMMLRMVMVKLSMQLKQQMFKVRFLFLFLGYDLDISTHVLTLLHRGCRCASSCIHTINLGPVATKREQF